jgi:hypothetical protein
MIRFHCFECHREFQAERFNLANITVTCPVCETHLHIAQSLGRVYGKAVGDAAIKIIAALEKLCDKSKDVLTIPIDSAYARIVALCEEADREAVTHV